MVEDVSLFARIKKLSSQMLAIVANIDVMELSHDEREVLTAIGRELEFARLAVRDYEYADTRDDQVEQGETARTILHTIHELLLEASRYGMFEPIDVADFDARLAELTDALS